MNWDMIIILSFVYLVIDRICDAYVEAHKPEKEK